MKKRRSLWQRAGRAEGDLGPLAAAAPCAELTPTVRNDSPPSELLRWAHVQMLADQRAIDRTTGARNHRELPAAAVDELGQRSDARITATGFDRRDRWLRHSRALRKLTL